MMNKTSGMETMFFHTGVVTAVSDRTVEVEIFRPEGCGGCSLNSVCSQGERKLLTAIPAAACQPGDQVTVEITNRQGWLALFWGIVMPFLCTISGVLAGVQLTGSEVVAAGIGLASAAAYYGVFYLFRTAAAQKFTITARPV